MHFPRLTTKSFESNELELKLIENFINSKVVPDDFDLKNMPNLSLNFTVNYMSNYVNRFEVLDNNCDLYETPSSSEIINQMKELFILETRKISNNKKEEEQEQVLQVLSENNNAAADYGGIKQVGTVTPSEDFLFLLTRDVAALNDMVLRKQKFEQYAEQIQSVIERLLFKSVVIQTEKITLALETYKKEAELYDLEGFNSWIINLKTQIQSRNMNDFWENVMVKNSIGPISDGAELRSFFIVNRETIEENGNNDIDDMFDKM